MNDINKATSSREIEDIMFAHAADQRRDGETSEQAFARLVADGDEEITKALAALDQVRAAPTAKHGRVAKRCAEQLDRHVEAERRDGESIEQTYARLADNPSPTFADLYFHLRDLRGG